MKAPDEWVDLYRSKFGIYENFTNKLEDLIKDLLHAIDIVQINYRPKTIESFADKINREGKDYLDPIQEITDLVGIRIICYYLEDVNVVSEILKREFKIDLENSIDKSQILDPDKFGYLSVHYIITLADNRKDLTEWKDYSEIKAEIQVRTALQHAWAAIDHKLRYKTAKEVPLNLRRKLFRLSALLELGDEEFSNLKKLTEKVERIYSRDVLKGKLDVDINLNSLAIYLDSTKEGTLFAELATKAGFTVREHKIDEKSIMLGKLFNLLYILNINKIAELDKILQDSLSWAQEALSTFFKIAKENNLKSYAISYTTIIFLLVIYANKNILDMEKLIALKLSNKALEIYKEIGIK